MVGVAGPPPPPPPMPRGPPALGARMLPGPGWPRGFDPRFPPPPQGMGGGYQDGYGLPRGWRPNRAQIQPPPEARAGQEAELPPAEAPQDDEIQLWCYRCNNVGHNMNECPNPHKP